MGACTNQTLQKKCSRMDDVISKASRQVRSSWMGSHVPIFTLSGGYRELASEGMWFGCCQQTYLHAVIVGTDAMDMFVLCLLKKMPSMVTFYQRNHCQFPQEVEWSKPLAVKYGFAVFLLRSGSFHISLLRSDNLSLLYWMQFKPLA